MTKITPDQEAWLKSNYRLYSNYHLSVKLGVKQYTVENWLRKFDLRKRQTKVKPITEDQKKFIIDNYQKMTAEKLASKLNIAVCRVRNYCKRNKLLKRRSELESLESKIHYDQPAQPAYVRPKGEYSAGYEATIEKYLNKDI